MTQTYQTNLALFSDYELEILELFKDNDMLTPLSISKQTTIPRPSIYVTLEKLGKRGIVECITLGKKRLWQKISPELLRKSVNGLESQVFDETISVTNGPKIKLFKNRYEIVDLFKRIIIENKGERLIGIQGDYAGETWKDNYGVENLNEFNINVKKHNLITEIITSEKWFVEQTKIMGKEWSRNFSGRSAQVHFLNSKYLDYYSQIFIFKDDVFIVSMKNTLVVQLTSSDIVKMFKSMILFIEDNTRSVDINKYIETLIRNN